jgi:hypothetical protein
MNKTWMPIWRRKNQSPNASQVQHHFKIHKKPLCSLTQIWFSPFQDSIKIYPLIHHKLHLISHSYAPLMKSIPSLNDIVGLKLSNNLKVWAIWNHDVTQNYAWFLCPTLGLSLWLSLCILTVLHLLLLIFKRMETNNFLTLAFYNVVPSCKKEIMNVHWYSWCTLFWTSYLGLLDFLHWCNTKWKCQLCDNGLSCIVN